MSATEAAACRSGGSHVHGVSERHPLVIADGTLEALKWLAAAVMLLDHFNKFFGNEQSTFVFAAGRLVMPVFGFVLAYNLARPGARLKGVHGRMLWRLGLFALLSTPIVIALNHSVVKHNAWWPLNILFTLWVVVATVALIERGGWVRCGVALLVFLLAGTLVEYLWFGVMACLGAYAYCRDSTAPRLLTWFLSVLALSVINGNAWALTAIPLILVAIKSAIVIPKRKWIFYWFYPAHLLVLLLVRYASD